VGGERRGLAGSVVFQTCRRASLVLPRAGQRVILEPVATVFHFLLVATSSRCGPSAAAHPRRHAHRYATGVCDRLQSRFGWRCTRMFRSPIRTREGPDFLALLFNQPGGRPADGTGRRRSRAHGRSAARPTAHSPHGCFPPAGGLCRFFLHRPSGCSGVLR